MKHVLVFNNGEIEVPVDEDTWLEIDAKLNRKQALTKTGTEDYPDGVETFSASIPPPPAPPKKQAFIPQQPKIVEPEPEPELEDEDDDDTDWAGVQDDAEDGVGQI